MNINNFDTDILEKFHTIKESYFDNINNLYKMGDTRTADHMNRLIRTYVERLQPIYNFWSDYEFQYSNTKYANKYAKLFSDEKALARLNEAINIIKKHMNKENEDTLTELKYTLIKLKNLMKKKPRDLADVSSIVICQNDNGFLHTLYETEEYMPYQLDNLLYSDIPEGYLSELKQLLFKNEKDLRVLYILNECPYRTIPEGSLTKEVRRLVNRSKKQIKMEQKKEQEKKEQEKIREIRKIELSNELLHGGMGKITGKETNANIIFYDTNKLEEVVPRDINKPKIITFDKEKMELKEPIRFVLALNGKVICKMVLGVIIKGATTIMVSDSRLYSDNYIKIVINTEYKQGLSSVSTAGILTDYIVITKYNDELANKVLKNRKLANILVQDIAYLLKAFNHIHNCNYTITKDNKNNNIYNVKPWYVNKEQMKKHEEQEIIAENNAATLEPEITNAMKVYINGNIEEISSIEYTVNLDKINKVGKALDIILDNEGNIIHIIPHIDGHINIILNNEEIHKGNGVIEIPRVSKEYTYKILSLINTIFNILTNRPTIQRNYSENITNMIHNSIEVDKQTKSDNIGIKNVEKVLLIDLDKESYRYLNQDYQGGTHASPREHYRRGTTVHLKNGTTYERRGGIVNKGANPVSYKKTIN